MMKELLTRPAGLVLLFLLAVGAGTFVAVGGAEPERAWQAYLVNFLFWSGLAQAGVVFVGILHLTNADWAGPVKKLALGGAGFLPVSFVLFLLLYFGRHELFPWVEQPIPALSSWLNVPSLFLRDGLGLLLLYGLSLSFTRHALRAGGNARIPSWFPPTLIIVYAVVFSLLAFDLVMSLAAPWYSALFGGYFFIGNLYLGIAAVTMVAAMAHGLLPKEIRLTAAQFHDLGKLVFAFCLLWTYLFWSQYLVIWYGDMPEETTFIFKRITAAPWPPLAWTVLLACFLIPFVTLLSRTVKRRAALLGTISGVVVAGMWVERYVLIVPSLWRQDSMPLGAPEAGITLGFFAATALAYLFFLRASGILPPRTGAAP